MGRFAGDAGIALAVGSEGGDCLGAVDGSSNSYQIVLFVATGAGTGSFGLAKDIGYGARQCFCEFEAYGGRGGLFTDEYSHSFGQGPVYDGRGFNLAAR